MAAEIYAQDQLMVQKYGKKEKKKSLLQKWRREILSVVTSWGNVKWGNVLAGKIFK